MPALFAAMNEPLFASRPAPAPSVVPPAVPFERKNPGLVEGAVVRVRRRTWAVTKVTKEHSTYDLRVSLVALDDDARGETLDVLWDRELDAVVQTSLTNGERGVQEDGGTRGFDSASAFAAYLSALGWNQIAAADPQRFLAPFRAGIQVHAYQLAPLQRALRLPRVNLFIADDVGLGKTIEAGLIIRELMLRERVRRVIVVCPPSVLRQWRDELFQRFGLRFTIYDREHIVRVRRSRGHGASPFSTGRLFLVSTPLLRDDDHRAALTDFVKNDDDLPLEDQEPALLVVDEAHHAAPSHGSRYPVDSATTRAVRELSALFEHRLFLSATPHNGHTASFSALLEMVDPQRFVRGIAPEKAALDAIVVRRLKEDLRLLKQNFPERHVVATVLGGTALEAGPRSLATPPPANSLAVANGRAPSEYPELHLAALLARYRDAVLGRIEAGGAKKRDLLAATLVLSGLQKRLFSSVEAFARTLAVHQKSRISNAKAKYVSLPRLLPNLTAAEPDTDAEPDSDGLDALDDAAALLSGAVATAAPVAGEEALLGEMQALAATLRHQPDARVRALAALLRPRLLAGKKRFLIFTEYTDSERYLVRQLKELLGDVLDPEGIVGYHGSLGDDRREALKSAFNDDLSANSLRILVATDAAREGVNLQATCDELFHFDLPWNPARLEQRNGRIDRTLQPSKEVFCHYFLYKNRPEDRILDALVAKTERIRKELGSVAPVLVDRAASRLDAGIDRNAVAAQLAALEADLSEDAAAALGKNSDEDALLKGDPSEDDPSFSTYVTTPRLDLQRQEVLRQEMDDLRQLMDRARQSLNVSPELFRDALNEALLRVGGEPFVADPKVKGSYRLSAVTEKALGSAAFYDALDTLRAPREPGETFAEYRRRCPVRPVVFHDTGRLSDPTVHLHLEPPFARRLLDRFLAAGHAERDLARRTVASFPGSVPQVVLFGRLRLYGPNGARLHDELLAVRATLAADGTVVPTTTPVEAPVILRETLDALHRAVELAPPPAFAAAEADAIEAALAPALEEKRHARAGTIAEALRQRGDEEKLAMTRILTAQVDRIKRHLVQVGGSSGRETTKKQLDILFEKMDPSERKTFESNRKYWERRLAAAGDEIAKEPERIAGTYRVQSERFSAVGLVILWPLSG